MIHLSLSVVLVSIFSLLAPGKCSANKLLIADDEGLLFGETQNDKNRRLQTAWNRNLQQKCCPQDGIGSIWATLILGISRNPSLKDELYRAALIGTAVTLAGDKPENTFEKAAVVASEIEQIFDTLFDNGTFPFGP